MSNDAHQTPQSEVITYRIYRPGAAFKALPVHLERVITTQAPVFESSKFARMERKVRSHWLGSFATTELAEGKKAMYEARGSNHHQPDHHEN